MTELTRLPNIGPKLAAAAAERLEGALAGVRWTTGEPA